MLRDLFSLFPAYAGVILTAALRRTLQKTFPRIRGGDPSTVSSFHRLRALFPAYAGVILIAVANQKGGTAFPRTCGGDPLHGRHGQRKVGFSPHMRG